ncbi:SIR2 family protein [Mucilaginibacter kameinonensis]|uniref:SIR2 family protein n=1 Tax=Mucilaginibacter kameinonensis TaxID=452286 RepID=UPI000EF78BBB|nr:SIR2 family protein [Mucilaginibacter kameinonensis]
MRVSLILGAGFSYSAGLPVVSGVSARFLKSPLFEQVLCFGSTEWKWKEWASTPDLQNGILPNEHIPVAMVLEKFIRLYLSETHKDELNYEKFYQYLVDMCNNDYDRFRAIKLSVQKDYEDRFQFRDYNFEGMTDGWIFSCFYHLVDDMLWVRKSFEEIYKSYRPYLDYFLNQDHSFNIYTLNHDLLLERIFNKCDINYDDGFSVKLNFLMDYDNKERVPVFDGSFGGRINLLKLHGSIDVYKYTYIEESNRHKGYDYFKTMDYHTKHGAIDVDEKGNPVQKITPSILPRFITGDNKFDIIQNDKMYQTIYQNLEQNLPASDQLIVVGYSFQDEHINRVIESSLPHISEVIHINPSLEFPFEHKHIRQLNPKTEAIQL